MGEMPLTKTQKSEIVEVQREEAILARQQLSEQEVTSQVALVQRVMKSVMQKDVHYGTIPGCGDKPALFKSGAEILGLTFRLVPDITVEDLSKDDERRYRVITKLIHAPTGAFMGSGVGEASSMESKWRWRRAFKDEWDATPPERRRSKQKGSKGNTYTELQVMTEPADVANTVVKMAKKRSYVDAMITATNASSCFTQDIEEMAPEPEEPPTQPKKEYFKPPEEQPKQPSPEEEKAPWDEPEPEKPRFGDPMTDPQKRKIHVLFGELGMEGDANQSRRHAAYVKYGADPKSADPMATMTKLQAMKMIDAMQKSLDAKKPKPAQTGAPDSKEQAFIKVKDIIQANGLTPIQVNNVISTTGGIRPSALVSDLTEDELLILGAELLRRFK